MEQWSPTLYELLNSNPRQVFKSFYAMIWYILVANGSLPLSELCTIHWYVFVPFIDMHACITKCKTGCAYVNTTICLSLTLFYPLLKQSMCVLFLYPYAPMFWGWSYLRYSFVCRCICDGMMLLLPQTDLTDVDMEDDMKHIVSDEIRRFRQSYKVSHYTFITHPCTLIALNYNYFMSPHEYVRVHVLYTVTALAACGKGICLAHHTTPRLLTYYLPLKVSKIC